MHHENNGEVDHKDVVKILAKTSRDWFGGHAPHQGEGHHATSHDEGRQGD